MENNIKNQFIKSIILAFSLRILMLSANGWVLSSLIYAYTKEPQTHLFVSALLTIPLVMVSLYNFGNTVVNFVTAWPKIKGAKKAMDEEANRTYMQKLKK